MRLRYSIPRAMAVVLLVAVGLAAVTRPSAGWVLGLSALYLALIGLATLASLRGRGGNRAVCVGIAARGGAYLGLWTRRLHVPGYDIQNSFLSILSKLSLRSIDGGPPIDEVFLTSRGLLSQVLLVLGGFAFAAFGGFLGRLSDIRVGRH